MHSLTDRDLDELLGQWHQWRAKYRPALGHDSTAPGCSMYRSSRQYESGWMVDDELERRTLRAIEHEVGELAPLHQLALQVQARALALGLAVWHHPRLPADAAAREQLEREARAALARRLAAAGVL